ncbi:hypothetical protein Ahy_B03g062425 isoform A [Arachis hypogaea]|uniref:Uncharacterized protein n=1 Tax=Arachis hypogaea TaxID=3818 RepID=A0A444ZU37_ARAHY|nr:hypothetical protein Ahy_B03g062425 isoform A [Arachis hypogaea]
MVLRYLSLSPRGALSIFIGRCFSRELKIEGLKSNSNSSYDSDTWSLIGFTLSLWLETAPPYAHPGTAFSAPLNAGDATLQWSVDSLRRDMVRTLHCNNQHMSTCRHAADQATGRGHSHGRVSFGTFGTSGFSLSTPTTTVTPQIADLADQQFIMVPNPNYMPPSTATTPPPIAQHPATTSTPPPAMDTAALESSHISEVAADASPPPPIIRLNIWPNDSTRLIWLFAPNNNTCNQEMTNIIKLCTTIPGPAIRRFPLRPGSDGFRNGRCTLGGTQNTTSPSRRYSTIECIGGSSRCWMMFEINEGFRHRHLTKRANRALTKSSKYTGGTVTFMKTKARLSESLNSKTTLVETFKYTYTLKEIKETFADQQLTKSYTQRLEATTQQSQQGGEDATDGSAASFVNSNAVWHETASAPYKNRVYKMGSFFASSLHTST